MEIVDDIATLFERHGSRPYVGARQEAITALEHALQCAQLAEWANAEDSLVAAAFLHDVGHLLSPESVASDDRVDDRHEELAARYLATAFDDAVIEPVRLHVPAKRFLVRTDEDYARSLSPASVHSLGLQGGPMSDQELDRFWARPHAREAVMLRRWDDLAKVPGRTTPGIDWYLDLLRTVLERPVAGTRTRIAAAGVA